MRSPSRIRFGISALTACCLPMLWACANHRSASQQEVALIETQLALGPGSVVADVGAGDGRFSLALARRLGLRSQVFATEIDSGALAGIARRAQRDGLDNVTTVTAQSKRTGLPEACCDAVFMRGVYHHLTDPVPLLEDLYRVLRPGGRALVIDFAPSFWLRPWTPKGLPAGRTGHGINPETVRREAESVGFMPGSVEDDWPSGLFMDLYGLVLHKPEGPRETP